MINGPGKYSVKTARLEVTIHAEPVRRDEALAEQINET